MAHPPATPRPRVTPAALLILGLAGAIGLLAGVKPSLALVAVAAAAFIAILLANFTVATGIFITVTFINLPDNAIKLVGILLALALLARIVTSREHDISFSSAHPVATTAVVLFLAWTLLGIVWAKDGSAVSSALFRYALNVVLLFLIYAAARTRSDVLLLIACFVLGCAIAAAYGLVYPPAPGLYDDLSRTGGTLGDPNELAAVLVVGLFLSSGLAVVRSVPGPIRLAAIGAGLLCLAGIALSLSRGGLLGLGVALVIGVLVAGRWRVYMATLTVIVAIGTVAYFSAYASPQALQRITSAQGGSGRSDLWLVGWRMFEANPIGGVGAGNFPVVSVNYLLRPGTLTHSQYIAETPLVAHNTYLNVFAEGGIVGGALFIGILGFALSCYQRAWRAFRRSGDRDLEILSYALFIGLVGFLAASFFISEEFNKQLWVLIALAPALRRLSVKSHPRAVDELDTADPAPGPRAGQPQLVGS